ncbi:MAG: hypothetical protein V1928_00435 [Parcubacteria group bacterium]
MPKFEHSDFLKKKYDLHNAPETRRAVKAAQNLSGERIPQSPDAQIEAYLGRLEKLVLDPEKKQSRKMMFGKETRPRALSLLREKLLNAYVRPNKEKMAESAARVEERAARELGIDARYGEQELEQRGEIAVIDIENSLDNWLSYLTDANEKYPVWFRYYAFRNILDLGDFDKDKKEFSKRSKGSFKLFPDIDRGALAYVEQMIEASQDDEMLETLIQAQKSAALDNIPKEQLITKEKVENFAKMSFAKQYAEAILQAGEITDEMRKETKGKWMKYQKGTDATALWASLQNKGTAWCTKGLGTAQTQLKGGDFYVYYTLNKQGVANIPRIAIRMQEDVIGEARGVADNAQNLEGNMAEIAEKKMNELPGAEKYRKASKDMKKLTEIDKKTRKNETLTQEELIFLYEMNGPIEGFGYQRDPRIKEIIAKRNPKEDAPVVFNCAADEIAWKKEDVDENTKAYVGELFPGVFGLNIEHVYTSFPEGKIQKYDIIVGGKDKKQLVKELKEKNVEIYDSAKQMIDSGDFKTLKKEEKDELVRLTVGALGLKDGATTQEIYDKAEELGLELCPPEAGPQLRLHYSGNDWMLIAMKQISGFSGDPSVFSLNPFGDRPVLDGINANPSEYWNSSYEFVFRSRKFKNLKT